MTIGREESRAADRLLQLNVSPPHWRNRPVAGLTLLPACPACTQLPGVERLFPSLHRNQIRAYRCCEEFLCKLPKQFATRNTCLTWPQLLYFGLSSEARMSCVFFQSKETHHTRQSEASNGETALSEVESRCSGGNLQEVLHSIKRTHRLGPKADRSM